MIESETWKTWNLILEFEKLHELKNQKNQNDVTECNSVKRRLDHFLSFISTFFFFFFLNDCFVFFDKMKAFLVFCAFLCACAVAFSADDTTDLTKTLDTISARRSVRKFDLNRTVDDDTIHTILDCAMDSPSAMNSREWRYIVVRDQTTRQQIADSLPYCKYCGDPTAVLIIVVAELAAEKAPGHWPQNCAAASMSMLLGATTLGVGSTWTSLHPYDDVCFLFSTLFH